MDLVRFITSKQSNHNSSCYITHWPTAYIKGYENKIFTIYQYPISQPLWNVLNYIHVLNNKIHFLFHKCPHSTWQQYYWLKFASYSIWVPNQKSDSLKYLIISTLVFTVPDYHWFIRHWKHTFQAHRRSRPWTHKW